MLFLCRGIEPIEIFKEGNERNNLFDRFGKIMVPPKLKDAKLESSLY
jgi:hypothetical protein